MGKGWVNSFIRRKGKQAKPFTQKTLLMNDAMDNLIPPFLLQKENDIEERIKV